MWAVGTIRWCRNDATNDRTFANTTTQALKKNIECLSSQSCQYLSHARRVQRIAYHSEGQPIDSACVRRQLFLYAMLPVKWDAEINVTMYVRFPFACPYTRTLYTDYLKPCFSFLRSDSNGNQEGLNVGGQIIYKERLAVTLFWDGRQHMPSEINTKSICRNYRTGKCLSGFKCKKLHICKEIKLYTGCHRVDANGANDAVDTMDDMEETDDFVECLIKSLSIPRKVSSMPRQRFLHPTDGLNIKSASLLFKGNTEVV